MSTSQHQDVSKYKYEGKLDSAASALSSPKVSLSRSDINRGRTCVLLKRTPVTTHLQARAGAVAVRAVRAEATMRGNYIFRVLESSNRAPNG